MEQECNIPILQCAPTVASISKLLFGEIWPVNFLSLAAAQWQKTFYLLNVERVPCFSSVRRCSVGLVPPWAFSFLLQEYFPSSTCPICTSIPPPPSLSLLLAKLPHPSVLSSVSSSLLGKMMSSSCVSFS